MKAEFTLLVNFMSVGVETSFVISDLVLSSLSRLGLSGAVSPVDIFTFEGENLVGLCGVWETRSLSWLTLIGLKLSLSWADWIELLFEGLWYGQV